MGGWVYIITNKPHGVLYTGVTSNLEARIQQHRSGTGSKFAKRYAIGREKAIKEWPRLWKLRMIQEANPKWEELAAWDPGLRRDDDP